jgi:hypothetical protein
MELNSKCNTCNTKVYLPICSTCKCLHIFCSKHITNHECLYDYKEKFTEKLTKQLVVCEADKIDKI